MTQQTQEGINPAWQPLLSQLPESLHALVVPHQKQWDANFQQELQKAKEPYSAYQILVDNNVPMERIDEALRFVYDVENKPEEILPALVKHFDVKLEQAPPPAGNRNDDDPFNIEDDEVNLNDNPVIKQLLEQGQKIQDELDAQKQAQAEAQALTGFNSQVDNFLTSKEEYKVIPRELLIAYMSQGASIEDAADTVMGLVKTQLTVTPGEQQQQQTQQNAPTLMGGSGQAGSGLPDGALKPGSMKASEVDDLVLSMLQANADQNNQG